MKFILASVILAIVALVHAGRVRIIEGTFANLHEFPYQVSLQWNFNNGSRARHFCSGSILNRKWILTAAHCKPELPGDGWIEVVAGVNNIASEEAGGQRRNVSRFVQHERYNSATIRNDIAVILLSKPLELNSHITTITLAPNTTIVDQTEGKLAGWGSISTNFTDIFPDELRKVNLPLRTSDDCQEFGASDSSTLCGGGYRNVSGCTADSGGPLTVEQGDGEGRLQIGVLSYGEKPCRATRPIVFSSVVHFFEWIESTIKARRFKWTS